MLTTTAVFAHWQEQPRTRSPHNPPTHPVRCAHSTRLPTHPPAHPARCGHCKSTAPKFQLAASSLKGIAKVGGVNCDVHSDLCSQHGVKSFPSIKAFVPDVKSPKEYKVRLVGRQPVRLGRDSQRARARAQPLAHTHARTRSHTHDHTHAHTHSSTRARACAPGPAAGRAHSEGHGRLGAQPGAIRRANGQHPPAPGQPDGRMPGQQWRQPRKQW